MSILVTLSIIGAHSGIEIRQKMWQVLLLQNVQSLSLHNWIQFLQRGYGTYCQISFIPHLTRLLARGFSHSWQVYYMLDSNLHVVRITAALKQIYKGTACSEFRDISSGFKFAAPGVSSRFWGANAQYMGRIHHPHWPGDQRKATPGRCNQAQCLTRIDLPAQNTNQINHLYALVEQFDFVFFLLINFSSNLRVFQTILRASSILGRH